MDKDMKLRKFIATTIREYLSESLKYSGDDKLSDDEILDEFYSLNGWDGNGIPTRETLEKLNLKDVADDLEERKVIPR